MKNSKRPLQFELKELISKAGTQSQVLFSASSEDEEVFHQKDLIELSVFGLSLTPDANHPFLLLKDKSQTQVLSVMINPLEAGVTLTQSNKSIKPVTPHHFAQELLKSLDIEIQQCVFVQIKGESQFVRLYLKGHPRVNSLKFRAEEVMSLVLHFNIPLLATKNYIDKAKILDVHLQELTKVAAQSQKINFKNQPYII